MEETTQISYDDFAKLDIRIGTVLAAEAVPETDKLLKCTVDFGLKPSAQRADGSAEHSPAANGLGERDIRTIVSGIRAWKQPEDIVGTQLPYVVNLAPRIIKGIESQGMLLAGSVGENGLVLLRPEEKVPSGTRLK